jgi:surface antigen
MTSYVIENTNKTRRLPIVALVVVALGLMPVAGCQTIERETGLSLRTQRGAAAGAAFGGIIAALANANPAWIAASVIMGGVAGGAISNHLGREDSERHARTNYSALDRLKQGQTDRWENKKTGNYGSTTVTRVTTQSGGVLCKSYREEVHTRAESVTKEGTACKDAGGSWRAKA